MTESSAAQLEKLSSKEKDEIKEGMWLAGIHCPVMKDFVRMPDDVRGTISKITCTSEGNPTSWDVRLISSPPYGKLNFEKW